MRQQLAVSFLASAIAIAACTGNQRLPAWQEGEHLGEELEILGPVLIQRGAEEDPEDETACLTSGADPGIGGAELRWAGGTGYNVEANEVVLSDGREMALASMIWLAGYRKQAAQNFACRTAMYQGRLFDVVEVHLEEPIVNATATPPATRP